MWRHAPGFPGGGRGRRAGHASARAARMAGEVGAALHLGIARAAQQCLHGPCLVPAVLQQQPSARGQAAGRLHHDGADVVQPVRPARQGLPRLVHQGRQVWIVFFDVGWVGHDGVEGAGDAVQPGSCGRSPRAGAAAARWPGRPRARPRWHPRPAPPTRRAARAAVPGRWRRCPCPGPPRAARAGAAGPPGPSPPAFRYPGADRARAHPPAAAGRRTPCGPSGRPRVHRPAGARKGPGSPLARRWTAGPRHGRAARRGRHRGDPAGAAAASAHRCARGRGLVHARGPGRSSRAPEGGNGVFHGAVDIRPPIPGSASSSASRAWRRASSTSPRSPSMMASSL